ncbi:MAG: TerC family protein [Fimbriimonadaceae bacterium]|nr:TerC family protein [Fimbriimonadaceae bacterium]
MNILDTLQHQTFSPGDMGTIAFLILLEGLLSADNALVLAIMVRHLPGPLQKKALLYGLGGAFVFRFIAIIFASYILDLWFLQLAGAAYLLYLPIKHFAQHATASEEASKELKGKGFWATVIAVEFTDIAFAVDSVLAAIGAVSGKDKIWVVYLGAILGIVLLRFAAGAFIRVLDKYPGLEHLAYALVGWVSVKLFFFAGHSYEVWQEQHSNWPVIPFYIPEMPKEVFWGVMLGIIILGTVFSLRKPTEPDLAATDSEPAEILDNPQIDDQS